MKLSPPASSSDLEAAREIARRLHQRRRREDQPAVPRPATGFGAPRPRPESTAPASAPSRPAPVTPPPPAFEAAPEPPSWDEPAVEAPPTGDASDSLAAFNEPAPTADAVTDSSEPPLDVEVEEPVVAPEEMIGATEPPPPEAAPEPEASGFPSSPFEVDLDETEGPAEAGYDAPAPPSWDDIVETCLGLGQASGAMLVDPSGQVFAARG